MSDIMEFPQTVEEFMEQYKVVDTDHIYSNGTVFVPIFRMKQWFDHVESENDHVEVEHGEWIKVHDWLHIPQEECGTYRCSACGQVMKYPWNYCPNCGAKMREEQMSVYESILKGLQEAVEYEKGNIALKSNTYTAADLVDGERRTE